MDPKRQREIASKGGRAAHAKGTAHQWNAEEASKAGRKGGLASQGGRGKDADNKIAASVADVPRYDR